MTYRHWHADIREWTTANLRAAHAYHTEQDNNPDVAREQWRALKRAYDQQRYRDRMK